MMKRESFNELFWFAAELRQMLNQDSEDDISSGSEDERQPSSGREASSPNQDQIAALHQLKSPPITQRINAVVAQKGEEEEEEYGWQCVKLLNDLESEMSPTIWHDRTYILAVLQASLTTQLKITWVKQLTSWETPLSRVTKGMRGNP